MILVDTTIWIDFFRSKKAAHVLVFESLIEKRETLCLCGVILAEVLQGIRDDQEYRNTLRLLKRLVILPMNEQAFVDTANLYRVLRSRGVTIRTTIDCMIAVVAMENNVPLLHNDRDFDLIARHSRLKIYPKEMGRGLAKGFVDVEG